MENDFNLEEFDGYIPISDDDEALLNYERYEKHLEGAVELFVDDVLKALESYEQDHDWMALADSIWDVYSHYIGFGEKTAPTSDHVIQLQQFENRAKANFLTAMKSSFDAFYTLPKEHALFALAQLLGDVKCERDLKELGSVLTGTVKQKYEFLINRIEDEIRKQGFRTKEQARLEHEHPEVARKGFRSFEDFCLEKIRQMPEEEREKFLAINSGDQTFYDMSKNWMEEYNKISGKTDIKTFKFSVSRAKKQYKESRKS